MTKSENTQCTKKAFLTMEAANLRTGEINSAIAATQRHSRQKTRLRRLRPYKCDNCNYYHLTSKTKKWYQVKKDPALKRKLRKESFIKRTAAHWSKTFERLDRKRRGRFRNLELGISLIGRLKYSLVLSRGYIITS